MGGSYSDFLLCLNTYNFQKLESLSNNYILMATSMECDNILIMNNSNNCFGFNTPPGSQNYNNLWNFLSSDRQTYNYVHNFGHIDNEINKKTLFLI